MSYSKMKIDDLRKVAGEKGLRDIEHLKKSELIELLMNVDLMMSKAAEKKDETAKTAKKTENKDETAKTVKKSDKTDEAEKSVKKTVKKAENADDKQQTEKIEEKKPAHKSTKKNSDKTAAENADAKQDTADNNETGNKKAAGQNRRKSTISKNRTTKDNTKGSLKESVKKNTDENEASAVEEKPAAKPEKADDKDESQDNKSERSAEIQENKPEKTAEKQEKKPEGAQYDGQEYNPALASGEVASGILEVLADGYGFIRSDNYMPGEKDIYISPAQIRKFGLRTGDIIKGPIRARMNQNEKFRALLFIESVNSMSPSEISRRPHFEDMTPIFPNDRIKLDYNNAPVSIRIVDLFSPIGKGQRGIIVSPPKAGKTTLLK